MKFATQFAIREVHERANLGYRALGVAVAARAGPGPFDTRGRPRGFASPRGRREAPIYPLVRDGVSAATCEANPDPVSAMALNTADTPACSSGSISSGNLATAATRPPYEAALS